MKLQGKIKKGGNEEMRKCIESGLNFLKIASCLDNTLFPIKMHNVFSCSCSWTKRTKLLESGERALGRTMYQDNQVQTFI